MNIKICTAAHHYCKVKYQLVKETQTDCFTNIIPAQSEQFQEGGDSTEEWGFQVSDLILLLVRWIFSFCVSSGTTWDLLNVFLQ